MKKILLALACAVFVFSASADVKTVYVNPIQNSGRVDNIVAKRLYKKALLGLTKAKTVSVASGKQRIEPGSPEAAKYDYILNMDIEEGQIAEANTVGNLVGSLSSLTSSTKKEPEWEGRLITNIQICLGGGMEVFKTTLRPNAVNKDKKLALFNATNNFDYDMTDMTDDAFSIRGEVEQAELTDKKGVVKKVRAGVGSKHGARKNQAFRIFKVVGDNEEEIGVAKCEQVIGQFESILSISGKKEAKQKLSELIQNNDGSYTINVVSCSKTGFLHDNFRGLDKMFTNEGRSHFLNPFGRTEKPKIAFLNVEINDPDYASSRNQFEAAIVQGMQNVPTINVSRNIYNNVEDARAAGIDALVEVSIDKVLKSTETNKEGKKTYKTEILYTISGVDVANNSWIDMKTFSGIGSSDENHSKANADALGLLDNNIQKFSEDLFPVAASIVAPEEVKKNVVKKVRIDSGTLMGVKNGMTFDIFEERNEGGADSRFLIGEGKVEKDGLANGEAILKIKGKNDADERLNHLIQNADEETKLVLISKASYNILDKGLNFLNRNK